MKLTVDLGDYTVRRLENAITRELIDSEGLDLSAIQDAVKTEIRERVAKELDDVIRLMVSERVATIIDEPINITNMYGEATGKTVSIRERIETLFKEVLNENVDEQGTPRRHSKVTRVDYICRVAAREHLEKHAEAEVQKIRKTAEAQISAAVGDFIARNLVAPVAAAQLGGGK